MEDDIQLVERFKRGNESAFDELVKRHYQRVCNILFHAVGALPNVEDMAQEVFLKAYHGLQQYRGDSTFSTWIYRIAVNVGLDELRREKRKRLLRFTRLEDLGARGHEVEDVQPGARRPDSQLEQKELADTLQRAMKHLPKKHRLVFSLREIEEFSYSEIAEIMGCSTGTVKSRLFYARAKLQRYLKSYLR